MRADEMRRRMNHGFGHERLRQGMEIAGRTIVAQDCRAWVKMFGRGFCTQQGTDCDAGIEEPPDEAAANKPGRTCDEQASEARTLAYHVFHGARPDAQSASRFVLSRNVSIACQKPS